MSATVKVDGEMFAMYGTRADALSLAEMLDQSTEEGRALADVIDAALFPAESLQVAHLALVAVDVVAAELEGAS